MRIAEPILVTGATGFIGRRLVARLLADGYAVRALVLPADAIPIEWAERVAIERGDVASRSDCARAIGDAQTVFHLAAKVGDWGRERDHHRITVRGTENVLAEAARRRARAVLSSSVVVYGHRIGREICHEDLPFGKALGPYSRAKQAQEHIAMALEASHSLKVTIVRPTNVFGPRSLPWVDLVCEALSKGQPTLIDGGRLDAALIYVDNLVDLFVLVAEEPATIGRSYNASDDAGITWLRYFTELAEIIGAPKPKSIPKAVAAVAARGMERAHGLFAPDKRPLITREALNLVGSHHRVPIGRAQRDLAFEPRVPYVEAMRAVAAYLRDGTDSVVSGGGSGPALAVEDRA